MSATPVTDEMDAGACGLDGEELTGQLLAENLKLKTRNATLKATNRAGFIVFVALVLLWIPALWYVAATTCR